MPPKKDPRNTALETALVKVKADIKRKTGKNVNNSILTTSVASFKALPSVNLGKTSKILHNIYTSELLKKEAANATSAEGLEKTGGIEVKAEVDRYAAKWKAAGSKVGELSAEQRALMKELNTVLSGSMQFIIVQPDTETPLDYGTHAIMRDIMIGKYDTMLTQLKEAVRRESGKTISAIPIALSITSTISFREHALKTSANGVTGGTRRRRRTNRRKSKTHRKH
jgi:hypothetical protein